MPGWTVFAVIGYRALQGMHLETEYMPQREGKKMWCLSDDVELRVRYIEWAKSLKERAREVYLRWKQGDFSVDYPEGMFPPARPKIANFGPVALEY